MNKLYDLYKEEFDFTASVLNLCADLLAQRKVRRAIEDDNEYNRLLLVLFGRNLKSLQAMYNLCANGFGEDAAVLLRSAIESTIIFYYILLNPKRNAFLYRRYEFVTELKSYEKTNPRLLFSIAEKDWSKESKRCIDEIAKYDLALSTIDASYDKSKQKKADERGLWSGKRISQMAHDLGGELQRQYELSYWIFSGFSHFNPFWMRGLQEEKPEKILIDVRPSNLMVREVLLGGICYYSIAMMKGANHFFQLNKDLDIQEAINEYAKITRSSAEKFQKFNR